MADRKLMKTIAEKFGGGPVGLGTLAATHDGLTLFSFFGPDTHPWSWALKLLFTVVTLEGWAELMLTKSRTGSGPPSWPSLRCSLSRALRRSENSCVAGVVNTLRNPASDNPLLTLLSPSQTAFVGGRER